MAKLKDIAGVLAAVICAASFTPATAAVFSIGPQNGFYGSAKCMDVDGNRLDDSGVPVLVYDCHAAGNQQFQFGGPNREFEGKTPSGTSIYTQSGHRCLDVARTNVVSYPCNGGASQQFNFINGMIVAYPNNHLSRPKCLDAPNFNNSTQLVIADCDGSDNQQFHIK